MLEQSPNVSVETLAGFTAPELIIPELTAVTASEVISELGAALLSQGCVQDLISYQEAVLARESISPTAFVSGWALPHARLPAIPKLKFAFGRTRQPVAWFGNTTAQVRSILLFAVPEDAAKAYLNVNAAVARLTQNVPLLEGLRTAPDAATIFSVLREVRLPYAHLAAGNRATSPVLPAIRTRLEAGNPSRI
jgi:mannitol/fructose-specific phosphotransferase system IIA component (Ntr-type)